jgi:hypothetical protein
MRREKQLRLSQITTVTLKLVRVAMTSTVVVVWSLPLMAVQINEIRVEHEGEGMDTDEYFELVGDPSESLDGLSYLVIGDDPTGGGSGVVEMALSLDGFSLLDDGFFFVAEPTFTLNGVSPDFVTSLNFENSDNVTHLLVRGFDGSITDDLDVEPEDGFLDVMPWDMVVDAVGLVESPDLSSVGSEFFYGATLGFLDLGPDGTFVPAHVFRVNDENSTWQVGERNIFAIAGGDSPGNSNNEIFPTLLCDLNFDFVCDVHDLDLLVSAIRSDYDERFDLDLDGDVDGQDVQIWLDDAAFINGFRSPYLTGDTELDGEIGAQDLNQIGINWLETEKVWSDGDFDGDGNVNASDLNKIGINWQQGTEQWELLVPEPISISQLLAGGLLTIIFRRRFSESLCRRQRRRLNGSIDFSPSSRQSLRSI